MAEKVVVSPKTVVEYPIPASFQTHEIAVVGGGSMLAVTQQPTNTLVKLKLSDSGVIEKAATHTLGNQYDGMHGITQSTTFTGLVWVTMQLSSKLLLLDLHEGAPLDAEPTIMNTIDIPYPARGPHEVVEDGEDLWVSCKDSGHIVRINFNDPSDNAVYPCYDHPIFVGVHPVSKKVYATLYRASSIFELDPSSGETNKYDIPKEQGGVPLGLIAGPDQNIWFTNFGPNGGAKGTFAKIDENGDYHYFHLKTEQGKECGIIHLAFEEREEGPVRLHLVPSTLLNYKGFDGLVTVTMDEDYKQVLTETTYTFPTANNWAHRIVVHKGVIYVTGMKSCSVIQVFQHAMEDDPKLPFDEDSDQLEFFGYGAQSANIEYKFNEALA